MGTLVDGETLNLGINATPQFIGALTELTYGQIENIAQDLEAFAKHRKGKADGKRRIEVGDVLLLGRRNEGLMEILEKEAERVEGRSKAKAANGRGKAANGTAKKSERASNGQSPATASAFTTKSKGKARARASRTLDDSADEEPEGEDLEDAVDDDEDNRNEQDDDDDEMADFIVDDE